jgi:hypothetical protein
MPALAMIGIITTVSIFARLIAGSVSLIGFGLDSGYGHGFGPNCSRRQFENVDATLPCQRWIMFGFG